MEQETLETLQLPPGAYSELQLIFSISFEEFDLLNREWDETNLITIRKKLKLGIWAMEESSNFDHFNDLIMGIHSMREAILNDDREKFKLYVLKLVLRFSKRNG